MLLGGSRRWRGPGIIRLAVQKIGNLGGGGGIAYLDVPLNDGDAAN